MGCVSSDSIALSRMLNMGMCNYSKQKSPQQISKDQSKPRKFTKMYKGPKMADKGHKRSYAWIRIKSSVLLLTSARIFSLSSEGPYSPCIAWSVEGGSYGTVYQLTQVDTTKLTPALSAILHIVDNVIIITH